MAFNLTVRSIEAFYLAKDDNLAHNKCDHYYDEADNENRRRGDLFPEITYKVTWFLK